jgi:tetratricopeptide (TPR) repeat protein
MVAIIVPGESDPVRQAQSEVGGVPLSSLGAMGLGVTVNDAVQVLAERSALASAELKAADDDVVEVTLDGGVRLFIRGDEVADRLGGAATRSLAVPGTIRLSPALPLDERERGLGSWAIAGLRTLGVDLPEMGARRVAEAVDERLAKDPGVFRLTAVGTLERIASDLKPSTEPWLLFLHGTFSNTAGSFGALTKPDGALWQQICERYDERVLTLEHPTLTASPIDNAIDVLEALPDGAVLHLVSHSRGGLIGELLCRSSLLGDDGKALAEPFDDRDLKLFRDGERAKVEQLAGLLGAKRPLVQRFVRVACPARGTTLASARLDRWLNMVLEVAGIGAAAVPGLRHVFEGMQAFLLAVVKERTDPRTIPGLEAMIPDSPLIRVLNRPDRRSSADLSIIKGDSAGSGVLRRLAIWLADAFYGEDHDLVVNTSAMVAGAARAQARVFFDQGASVDHFRYFSNQRTAERVVAGLLRADGELAGFQELAASAAVEMPRLRSRANDRRPIVYILPGITGSHLKAGSDRIWIHLWRLARGGLDRLEIDDPSITADEPVGLYYGKIAKFLDATHEVRPWPYDWRRPVLELGRSFGATLQGALETTDRPVRIVAHSMGGLVARSALIDPEVRGRFENRSGCRLVMLGTPNGGSFSIPFMLMGRNRMLRYIDLIDVTMDLKEHLRIISRWPGAIQMLPSDPAIDLFDARTWKELKAADPGDMDWAGPAEVDLVDALAFQTAFAKAPVDPQRMFYIAGQGITPNGIEVDPSAPKGSRIRFTQTHEGDGQVLWATGRLPGVETWYANASHGDLARHEPAFPAILDLLDKGQTDALPKAPRVRSRGQDAPPAIVREEAPIFPTEEDLIDAAIGGTPAPVAPPPKPIVRLSVMHGHLAFADHPVLVGHYSADAIAGPEAALDGALDGRLSIRRRMGQYPGPVETSAVVLDEEARPRGALVVGLGDAGSLAPGSLQAAIRHGLLAYVTAEEERCRHAAASPGPIGVSSLLIGSGDAGLPRAGCLLALLRAADEAQEVLNELERPLLGELQIIELVEYRALEIWHSLHQLLMEKPELNNRFVLADDVVRRPGAARQIARDGKEDWWQPIQITMAEAAENAGGPRTVSFATSAGRARVEATLIDANFDFTQRFIRQAIAGSWAEQLGPTPTRALFELLWPLRLKGHAGEDRSLRLILDEHTAAIPWELMDDRVPWGDGAKRKPPVVRSGVLRQLIQTQFREVVISPRRKTALVVGDPTGEASGFAELPGARDEAQIVTQVLRDAGFQVTSLIGDAVRPEQVVMHLLDQDWTIVHIAAHGVFDEVIEPGQVKQTGIVLGGGLVLGPSIFANMTVPPALVFLNCCHVGRVDPESEARRRDEVNQRRRPDFAASLAVQLIRIGAKGVIAAGWAVDDAAAACFARSFYEAFRNNSTFGHAIKLARNEAYRAQPQGTTWGAYQCYGEPDWRPYPRAEDGQSDTLRLASPVEAIAAIELIREALHVGLARGMSEQRRRLKAIQAEVERRGWIRRGEILLALGEASAELGDLAQAIEWYEKAIMNGDGRASIKAIEQCANLQARHALAAFRRRELSQQDADAAIASARQKVEKLADVCGHSAERWVIRGGCFKRAAQVAGGSDMTVLNEMRNCYREAGKLMEPAYRFYPALMSAAADLAIAKHNGRKLAKGVREELRRIGELKRSHTDFWQDIAAADAMLLASVEDGKIDEKVEQTLRQHYQKAWAHGGSPLKLMSALEQMAFLEDVLHGSRQANLVPVISRIRSALESELRPQ